MNFKKLFRRRLLAEKHWVYFYRRWATRKFCIHSAGTFGIFVRLPAIRRADLTAAGGAPEQAARTQQRTAERVQVTAVRHALAAVANSSS